MLSCNEGSFSFLERTVCICHWGGTPAPTPREGRLELEEWLEVRMGSGQRQKGRVRGHFLRYEFGDCRTIGSKVLSRSFSISPWQQIRTHMLLPEPWGLSCASVLPAHCCPWRLCFVCLTSLPKPPRTSARNPEDRTLFNLVWTPSN